jgi:hypothetical protein
MTKRIVNIPGTLTYWENWSIAKKEEGMVIVKAVLGREWRTIKEEDPERHLERIIKRDFKYICGLLRESPYHLEDPTLKGLLPEIEKELSLRSPFDKEAKKHLKKLHAAKAGDTRGKKKERMREIIERDLDLFRRITKRHEKTKQDIDGIIDYYLDQESYHGIGKNQLWAIYKAYRTLADDLLDPVFNGDWNIFLIFLNVCKDRIDEHSAIVPYGDFVFIKGEAKGDTFRASL